jgi:hypothetical protein
MLHVLPHLDPWATVEMELNTMKINLYMRSNPPSP